MTKLPLFACATFALGFLALSSTTSEAKRIISSSYDYGNTATSLNPTAKATEVVVKANSAEERSEFQSLVIADLPRPMGFKLVEMAKSLSEATGIDFEPDWFRLDMARFRSTSPFNGEELAAELGLEVVANYSEHLILAKELSAEAQQAEARVFLYELFDRRDRRIWRGFGSEPQDENVNEYDPWNNMVRVNIQNDRNAPEAKKNEFADLSLGDVFAASGPINTRGVMNALGLTEEDLDYPLSAKYPLDAFRLGKPAQNGYYSNSYYGQPSFNLRQAIASLSELGYRKSRFLEGDIEIHVHVGEESSTVLQEPSVEIFKLPTIADFFAQSRYRRSSNRYRYGSYYGNQPQTSPLHVSMRLGRFLADPVIDEKRLGELEKEVIEAESTRNLERLHDAQREAMLQVERALSIGKMNWIDKSAQDVLRDPFDSGANLRQSKRKIAKTAIRIVRNWALGNVGNQPPVGRLQENLVRNAYGINYNTFSDNNYNYSALSFERPTDSELAKNSIILRTDPNSYYARRNGKDWHFKVSLNFKTGDINWIEGEPESEEALQGRASELRQIAEHLSKQALKAKAEDLGESKWLREAIKSAPMELDWTSLADYSCEQIVPGFFRIIADDPGGVFSQKILFSVADRELTWETLEHTFKNPANGLSAIMLR